MKRRKMKGEHMRWERRASVILKNVRGRTWWIACVGNVERFAKEMDLIVFPRVRWFL